MTGNIIDLICYAIINLGECVTAYYLCNELIERKPRISVKIVIIGISYGIVCGVLSIFEDIIDGYLFRVLTTLTLMVMMKIISRKKIPEVLILYAIFFLLVVGAQAPSLLLISSLGLGTNQSITYLLTGILSTAIILYINEKVPLHKIYYKIEKELLLKLLIFSLSGIISCMFFYYNFQYTTSYVLYFSLLILITLNGLCQTLKNIFFFTNKVPMQLHDVKNILMGMYLSLYSTSDVNDIRKEMDNVLNLIGIDDIKINNIEINDYNQNILSFIDQKKSKLTKKELPFTCNINYYEPNAKVSFSVILYMLGVLLDNAIESGTKKVIIIDVSVIEEGLYVSVANEYKGKSENDFNKMFQEKYSTKREGNSRGYGLSNLSNVVRNYGGEILIKEEYNNEQSCNYLVIAINIKS